MASPSLQQIYNRINGVNNYHPFTADTFADWSLEAGDIVTVSQDGKAYSSPVHATTLRWTGQQQMELESHGEKQREALSKMSARAYNSGSGGGNSFRSSYFNSVSNKQRDTRISQNQSAITLEAWNRENADNQLSSRLTIEAGKIEAEVNRATSAESTLSGRITVHSDKISLVVEEKNGQNVVKAASIVTAINDSGSSVAIDADHIRIGSAGSSVKLADTLSITQSGSTWIKGLVTIGNSNFVTINNGTVNAPTLQVNSGGNLTFVGGSAGQYRSINYATINGMISDASVANNVLTLTTLGGGTINFSKATTLSGAWSGRVFTVTAKQNNVSVGTKAGIVYDGIVPDYTTGSWYEYGGHYYATQDFLVYADDGNGDAGETIMRKNLTINADAIYQAGSGSASHNIDIPSTQIYTTAGSPPSGSTNLTTMKNRVLSAIDDSETLVFRVDCGNASKYYHMIF